MDENGYLHRVVNETIENAKDLERDLDWFAEVLDARLRLYFGQSAPVHSILEIHPPDLDGSDSLYASFARRLGWSATERIVVLLGLVPFVRPQLLDVLWAKNETTGRGFTEFGGLNGTHRGGFVPTGETAAFILGGDNLSGRFEVTRLFEPDHSFARNNILRLGSPASDEPPLSGAISISPECRHLFTTGKICRPAFNSDFPARRIETQLTWTDLVLPEATLLQLEEIKNWILYGQELLREWEMEKKLQPGFTSLFCGPPGTGKTLSACLLAQYCNCEVYRIDLSMVVSKYVGETEKNLARVFDLAENKNWILFFDEADALFGKRTQTSTAQDHFSNQSISFLLQRVEEFRGVVILASNFKTNIDDAFLRRFHSVVTFPMPKARERLRLWRTAFSAKARFESSVDLEAIADKYDLSGGTIMNVVRYSSLCALSRRADLILQNDIETGIRREFLKEGRTV